MSNFRFGADDYKLSYYPPEASNGIGGVDWDKVESVEIEFDEFVKVVRCRDCVKFSEQEPDSEIGTCELGLEDTGLVSIVEPNGFCSWGERRTNDQMETQD